MTTLRDGIQTKMKGFQPFLIRPHPFIIRILRAVFCLFSLWMLLSLNSDYL